MCQVGEYTFEITIDGVSMVENERSNTQSANLKELRFSLTLAGLNLLIWNFGKLEPFPLISRL